MKDMDMQKQIKLGDYEPERHQGDSSSEPRQESPLVSQDSARVGNASHPDPSLADIVLPIATENLYVAQGSITSQVAWLTRHQFAHRFKLVYLDPPFFSNKDYGAFTDRWTSLNSYLEEHQQWLEGVSSFISDEGFCVLHCDVHASHYLKVIGDQIFGYENFRNEWIWHYGGRRQPAIQHVNNKHDTLLVWAKSSAARFSPVSEPWDKESYVAMKRQKVKVDEDGREWIWGHQGKGRPHAYRIYLDEHVARGRAIDSVWDIPIINTSAKERVGYPTQKPLALLTRVVELTTAENDWVADFAVGSGTTGVAARRLGRRCWLGDISAEAVALTIQRLEQG